MCGNRSIKAVPAFLFARQGEEEKTYLNWVLPNSVVEFIAFIHRELPGSLSYVHELAPGGGSAFDLTPKHAAVEAVAVLLYRQRSLRKTGEARVANR